MDNFQILTNVQITRDDKIKLKSVTCDSNYFYFTELKRNKIYKYTLDLELAYCYEVKRVYRGICYDNTDDCFWACIDKCCVIKLDHTFKEIDMYTIKDYDKQYGHINGISYDCNKDKLLITYSNIVIEINKNGGTEIAIKQKECGTHYCSALEIGDGYICSYTRNNFPAISVFDNDGKLVVQCCLSSDYFINDMMLYFDKNSKEQLIYVLASKRGCHSCFVKCRLSDSKETLENIANSIEHYDKECSIKEQLDKNTNHNSGCNIDEKEYNIQNCNHKTVCSLEDSYTNVIESVALLQTSLAHILNIEAEEIQQILTCSDCADEILKLNDEVRKNILRVLNIEQLISTIIETINEMIKKH